MEMTKKTYNILAIVAVCIAVVGLSVAFAALSSTLTISGTTKLKQASWAIDFLTPTNLSLSSSARWTDNPAGGAVEGTPTVSGSTVTFQAELDVPGDYANFTVPVKNNGTIDAVLSNYTANVTGTDSDLIILTVESGGSAVTNGSISLAAGQTKNIAVSMVYDPNITAGDLPIADRSITVQLTFVFVQD